MVIYSFIYGHLQLFLGDGFATYNVCLTSNFLFIPSLSNVFIFLLNYYLSDKTDTSSLSSLVLIFIKTKLYTMRLI